MNKKAFIFIVLAGIFWGSSGIFFNLLKPYGFTPLQMTSMRGVVSAIAMIFYTLIFNPNRFKVKIKGLVLFLLSGVAVFGTSAFYYAAIEKTGVSTAVILMYTAPVFVTAFSVLFLGEKLNFVKVISIITVFAGCALVSGIIGGMSLNLLGIIFGFGAALAYSAYNIFTRIEMMSGYNYSLSATLYCFIAMGITSVCFSNPGQTIAITAQKPAVIIPLIISIGVCTCVIPYFLYTLALRDIPAGTASALSIIEPMSATVFSVTFFNEELTVPKMFGIFLIFIAVFALNKSGGEAEENSKNT